jgi:hypothetical protein
VVPSDVSSMRIAQVEPPFETVPPTRYGGTERVVSTLAEELVRRCNDVPLFGSGDSRTTARLVPTVDQALWHRNPPYEALACGTPVVALRNGRM